MTRRTARRIDDDGNEVIPAWSNGTPAGDWLAEALIARAKKARWQ